MADRPTIEAPLSDRPLRVLIVDDQQLFASGLATMLTQEPGVEIVGTVNDGQQAVEMFRRRKPDVVLMDIKMPKMTGIEATKLMKAERPDVKVILLTIYDQNKFVFEGLKAGADGYLLKDSELDQIVRGIRAVTAGDYTLSPNIANQVIRTFTTLSSDVKTAPYQQLTDRQFDVLNLIAQGKANKEIALELGLSEKTVRNHISAIYQKLHIYGRTEAVLYALREGLLEK